jgi:hypothetical protein
VAYLLQITDVFLLKIYHAEVQFCCVNMGCVLSGWTIGLLKMNILKKKSMERMVHASAVNLG